MPGLSGLELLGQVLQHYPKTPVIVISGISDEEHAQGLIRLGAFDYLLKPFRLEVVERSVRRALDFRRKTLGGETKNSPDEGHDKFDWKIVSE
jgi:DNA-binding NtrC family response regulator